MRVFDMECRGRSPRVRGRPGNIFKLTAPAGSIPAGAGETHEHDIPAAVREVDPRGCGGDGRF